MKLLLASQSPRRKELLENEGFTFEIHPAISEEVFDEILPIDEALENVAFHKAKEIWDLYPDYCVLAADTIVYYQSKIIGKPKDIEEAKKYLHAFSGNCHKVKTGVCIICGTQVFQFVDTTQVHFRQLSDYEINKYINEGTCLDKAGAYGIQDCDFVDWIDGSFSNVVGLPTEKVKPLLISCINKG